MTFCCNDVLWLIWFCLFSRSRKIFPENLLWDHTFSTCEKVSEKWKFLSFFVRIDWMIPSGNAKDRFVKKFCFETTLLHEEYSDSKLCQNFDMDIGRLKAYPLSLLTIEQLLTSIWRTRIFKPRLKAFISLMDPKCSPILHWTQIRLFLLCCASKNREFYLSHFFNKLIF